MGKFNYTEAISSLKTELNLSYQLTCWCVDKRPTEVSSWDTDYEPHPVPGPGSYVIQLIHMQHCGQGIG